MSPRRSLDRFKIWRSLHADTLGVPIAVGMALLLGGGTVALGMSVRRSELVFAKVTGFRAEDRNTGLTTLALVQMNDRQFAVVLPKVHACRTGDRIALRRNNHLWGQSHSADPRACEVAGP